MSETEIIIHGTGGAGRELAFLIETCVNRGSNYRLLGFSDRISNLGKGEINGIPLLTEEEIHSRHTHARIIVAIGNPKVREECTRAFQERGFASATIIHPDIALSRWVEIGTGCTINTGAVLTTNIRIGDFVQININSTISHDVVIGDFTTISPGAHITGNVHLGKRVFIGAGAVIRNGSAQQPMHIGDDAVIGAGACVLNSVPANTTYVGVPARPLRSGRPH